MEANIIYRISQGDESAFDAFMDHYSPTLFRHAYGVVGNKEMAEEIVSDVFFEVWKARKDLLKIESLAAWMRTVTYHKSISLLRQETAAAQRISLDDIENFTASAVAAPDSDLISREEIDLLNLAISELPEKCRHVFYLAKIEKVPYKEIAQLLNITLATINYHVAYAMDALRKRLGHTGPRMMALLVWLGLDFF